ncbi:ABC transporter permease subunit [Natronolimnobius sp. AArcel1]|uniref:sugar ABC transporter permease n=1 Tax=Natronolimnobius sp. AArcel1 TaxID=1679093 RepID=UPI0013EA08BB|nr:ABC transporter permease subunit [Natronolimnobius sp. AArcel1]NGM71124.1 ABC transporter permease subunit [Natronolimnobius sp. AArcel1]
MSIAQSLRDDAVHAARWPIRVGQQTRRTLGGLKDGEIGITDIAPPVVGTLFAILVLLIILFPVYWMIAAAFAAGTGAASLYEEGFFASPTEWSLEAFEWVIYESAFVFDSYPQGEAGLLDYLYAFSGSYLANSLQIVIPTVIFSMVLIVPAAYAFSRHDFAGRTPLLYGYVLLTQVGSGITVAALIAIYVVFNWLGFTNSHLAIAALYAAGALPFNTWLLKTFMDSIPRSYEEAAIMDGAPRRTIFREIILPLSKPGLAAVLIFVFLSGWNEFILAQILLGADKYPLSVGLYLLLEEYGTPWGQFAAFSMLYALPVVLIYFFAQRYVESGLSFGGMDG